MRSSPPWCTWMAITASPIPTAAFPSRPPDMSQDFDALSSHAARLRGVSLSTLLSREPDRIAAHTWRRGPLYFNFARQSYDAPAWKALLAQGEAADLAGAFRRL